MIILTYLEDMQRKDFQTLFKNDTVDLLLKDKGVLSPELIMRMRMKRPRKTIKIKAENLKST